MAKILRMDGETIEALEKAEFALESDLQNYLERFPQIIPIEEISENPQPLTCIGKEVSVRAGETDFAIDLMYVDDEGLITIVETKLAKNPESRRQVIGQIIEYASLVSKWKANEVYDQAGSYLEQKLGEEMASLELGRFARDIWQKAEGNLEKGNMRLIVAVDELNEPLRAIVDFLNRYSNFDILLLQVRSFKEESGRNVIVSDLSGYATKSVGSRRTEPRWNWERFRTDIESRCEPDVVNAATKLYDFTKSNADNISWGTGASYGSFTFRKFTASIFTVQSDGRMYISFGGMIGKVKEEALRSFIKSLNEIPSLKIPEDAATRNTYPYMKVEILSKPNSLTIFQNAVLALCEYVSVKKEEQTS